MVALYPHRFTKRQLEQVPKPEMLFHLQAGQFANELNILLKQFQSVFRTRVEGAQSAGASAVGGLAVKMLAGKLCEAWISTNRDFAGPLLESYRAEMTPASLEAWDRIVAYFSGKNLIAKIRNESAFHNDQKRLWKGWNEIELDMELIDYFSRDHGNTLFASSDLAAFQAMLLLVPTDGADRDRSQALAMDQITKDCLGAVRWFNQLAYGYAAAFLRRHLPIDPTAIRAAEIVFGAPKLSDTTAQFFYELGDDVPSHADQKAAVLEH
jgi:hypothetical protein